MRILIMLMLLATPLVAQTHREPSLEELVDRAVSARIPGLNTHIYKEVARQLEKAWVKPKPIKIPPPSPAKPKPAKVIVKRQVKPVDPDAPLDTKDYTMIAAVVLGILSSVRGGNKDG